MSGAGRDVGDGNLLPALDPATEADLRASIERHGVREPIRVDQHGRIVDGHHRQRLAAELGVPCPVEPIEVRDDTDHRDLALTLNLDRRHLDALTRRRIVRELRDDGKTVREIAADLNVPKSTVQDDLTAAVRNRTPVETPDSHEGSERPRPQLTAAKPPRKKDEQTWLERLQDLDKRLPFVLRHRPSSEARTREALRVVDSIRRRLEGRLAAIHNATAETQVENEPSPAPHVAALPTGRTAASPFDPYSDTA